MNKDYRVDIVRGLIGRIIKSTPISYSPLISGKGFRRLPSVGHMGNANGARKLEKINISN